MRLLQTFLLSPQLQQLVRALVLAALRAITEQAALAIPGEDKHAAVVATLRGVADERADGLEAWGDLDEGDRDELLAAIATWCYWLWLWGEHGAEHLAARREHKRSQRQTRRKRRRTRRRGNDTETTTSEEE